MKRSADDHNNLPEDVGFGLSSRPNKVLKASSSCAHTPTHTTTAGLNEEDSLWRSMCSDMKEHFSHEYKKISLS
jgi:hypothetical protein